MMRQPFFTTTSDKDGSKPLLLLTTMQATRIVLSTAAAASERPFIIPPRRTWDIVKSAASASWTMLWSQEKRDQFVDTLNKGIISPEVLSQAEHGPAMVLALFHDLDSPLFTKYKFSAQEFSEGVKPALEEFHNVLGNLENELYNEVTESAAVTEEKDEDDGTSKDGDKDDSGESPDEAIQRVLDSMVMPPGEKDQLAGFLRVTKQQTAKIQQMLKKSWKNEAKEDPESYAGRLSAMVSPQYFNIIADLSKARYMTSNTKELYQDGSCEVKNVALLSARAMVVDDIVDESSEQQGGETTEKKIEDEELEIKEMHEEEFEKDDRVAAQVEVLYDIQQTYIVDETPDDKEQNDAKLNAENSKDNKKSDDDDEETVTTRSNVFVGVFEGWLNGNPDGTSDLRWKLILNRKAWEFPSFAAV